MNLVAKEFVASRTDEDGVLVLSEFAGAAAEMAEALHVNPFDISSTAETYHRALTMPVEERRLRMSALRRRVFAYDVDRWVANFLDALEETESEEEPPTSLAPTPSAQLDALAAELARAPHLVLLLDYDGTLVPFAPTPDEAAPDAALRELLCALAARARTDVHVVSGRERKSLERWLGGLPLALHAEHGFAWRPREAGSWTTLPRPPDDWRRPVRRILEDFRRRTPGALIEEKGVGLAWHYRKADPRFGELQAKDLYLHLTELLSNVPVEILPGDHVIEVRPYGIHKGLIVTGLVGRAPVGARIAALGDDRTDEDLFAALPDGGVAIHVGPGSSRAEYRVPDVDAARAFLRLLL
jgi:trehalose 6-phosphate synthase/phosphatase